MQYPNVTEEEMAEAVMVFRTEASTKLRALRDAAQAARDDFMRLPASERQEGYLILERVREKAELRRNQVSH